MSEAFSLLNIKMDCKASTLIQACLVEYVPRERALGLVIFFAGVIFTSYCPLCDGCKPTVNPGLIGCVDRVKLVTQFCSGFIMLFSWGTLNRTIFPGLDSLLVSTIIFLSRMCHRQLNGHKIQDRYYSKCYQHHVQD